MCGGGRGGGALFEKMKTRKNCGCFILNLSLFGAVVVVVAISLLVGVLLFANILVC